jgi:lipid A 3-O-deacylase
MELTPAYALGHLAGAAADGARGAVMLPGAVAVTANILAGAGGAGSRFVAGIFGNAAHGLTTRSHPGRFRPMKLLLPAALALAAAPASAQELFGGVQVHDVDTGLTKSGQEGGADLQLGWRGAPIRALRAVGSPAPHAYVSLNSSGDTHFASAGIGWKIGSAVYVRPAIGVAIHTGSDGQFQRADRIAFGSRILFAPEIGLGFQAGERLSVEASWVHLSHAQLFSRQNPGLDTIGVRLNYRFR